MGQSIMKGNRMERILQFPTSIIMNIIFMNKQSLAIVTGGSSGIGNAVCSHMLRKGYHVVNADIRASEMKMEGHYHYLNCDIASSGHVQQLSHYIQQQGTPEVLVLNAGIGIHEKLREGDPEKWMRVIDVNLGGSLRVIRAVLPFMNKGHVIFISSVSACNPYPYGGIYSATKSALETIAETLRQEEFPDIKVTVITPGVVNTSFFDNMISGSHSAESIGWGSLEPEEVAGAVDYILNQKKDTVINNITIRPSGQP